VEIGFDPAKDTRNWEKHGVSLAEAELFDLDEAVVLADERFEKERSGIGPTG
jgi:uncharacterized DUF497 family protein